MSRTVRAPWIPLVFAALALSGCGKVVGEGSKRLVVEAPKWWFQYLPLAVQAQPAGALAGQEASLTVAVGSNVAGRWQTKGEATSIRIPGAFFERGVNSISVKTGSERSTAQVVIVSIVWLVAPLVLMVLIVAALLSRWLRRRRGRQTVTT